jgi:hypothetical protein
MGRLVKDIEFIESAGGNGCSFESSRGRRLDFLCMVDSHEQDHGRDQDEPH